MAKEQYVSGEEHLALQHKQPVQGQLVTIQTRWMAVAAVILLCGLSFWGGTAYQKNHAKMLSTNSATANGGLGARMGGMRHLGTLGQVTAVSSTSITVTSQRTGTSSTYAITSSTAITDNGQPVTTSDIQIGATVIIATSSNSTTATRIAVNPSFGGAQAPTSSTISPNTAQTN